MEVKLIYEKKNKWMHPLQLSNPAQHLLSLDLYETSIPLHIARMH